MVPATETIADGNPVAIFILKELPDIHRVDSNGLPQTLMLKLKSATPKSETDVVTIRAPVVAIFILPEDNRVAREKEASMLSDPESEANTVSPT